VSKTDEGVLPNLYQVVKYLTETGYQVSYTKVKADEERRALISRRGGGFARRTVDKYAREFLKRRIDASPDADEPVIAPVQDMGAIERKTNSQAELAEITAMRARKAFAEEMGRLVKTSIIEAELGARAKAFRLGLERFAYEKAETVAEVFGGKRQADALAARLGIEGEDAQRAAGIIVDFVLSRAGVFTRMFMDSIDGFLDAYGSGRWWTEDMEAAWDSYVKHQDIFVPEIGMEKTDDA